MGAARHRELLGVATAIAMMVLLGACTAPDPPAAPDPGTERSARTIFGCSISEVDGSQEAGDEAFDGVTVVEPYCTDVALLGERCGVPPGSLRVPPTTGSTAGSLVRTYSNDDGRVVGSFIVYLTGGPPGVASSLICASGTTFDFTPDDWDRFNEPAEGKVSPSPTTTGSAASEPERRTLAPASTSSSVTLCSEPLVPTANGNAHPLFCDDGALNTEAWTYLAANNPSLMRLGPDATFDEVTQAICADVQTSINSTTASTYEIAAAYYGWSFDEDPTLILYSEAGCP